MPLVRDGRPTLEQLRAACRVTDDGENKALRSYFLSARHVAVIDLLAEASGKSKAEVVRDMIDEWAEMTLRGGR